MSTRTVDRLVLCWTAIVVLLFMSDAALPTDAAFRDVFTDQVLLYVGGLSKLVSIAVGAISAVRVFRTFGAGNPARIAWLCLAGWLTSWTFGQSTLVFYQWILRERYPFPSVADPAFVLGSVLMVVGFFGVVRAYVNTGFAFGDTRGLWILAAIVSVLSLCVAGLVLSPIMEGSGTTLEFALNLVYPVCDLIALVPAALLMRMTLELRGGALFRVWSCLIGGFLALAVGDVLYAYLTMLEQHWTTPVVDLAFILGYGLAARAMVEQRRLTV